MAYKAVLSSLDGLDESAKSLYVEVAQEVDGNSIVSYHLDIDSDDMDAVKSHRVFAPLSRTVTTVKAEKAAAEAEVRKLKSRLSELEKGAPDTAAVQAKLSELQEKLAAKEGEIGEWSQKYLGVTKDQAIKAALSGHGVTDPNAQRLASLDISRFVEVDDKGAAYVKDDFGVKTLDQFLKGWLAKDGAFLVAKPSGGGAQGGAGKATGGKSVTAAELESMTPQQKAKFFAENKGVTVV